MLRVMQWFTVVAVVMGMSWQACGHISVCASCELNGDGNQVWTYTVNSDGAPVSSLGINVVPNAGGSLGQVHPFGGAIATHLNDNNTVIEGFGKSVDQDTQALFNTAADGLLVVPGFVDTAELYDINFTGFEPFYSRDVMQVVMIGEGAIVRIGVVSGGEEYTWVPPLIGNVPCPPEPGSAVMLVLGSATLLRRKK